MPNCKILQITIKSVFNLYLWNLNMISDILETLISILIINLLMLYLH